MQEKPWYTLAQASLKMHKNKNYLASWFRRHPTIKPPANLLIKTPVAIFITDEGMQWVKEHTKKRGVHLRVEALRWATKQRSVLCFYP